MHSNPCQKRYKPPHKSILSHFSPSRQLLTHFRHLKPYKRGRFEVIEQQKGESTWARPCSFSLYNLDAPFPGEFRWLRRLAFQFVKRQRQIAHSHQKRPAPFTHLFLFLFHRPLSLKAGCTWSARYTSALSTISPPVPGLLWQRSPTPYPNPLASGQRCSSRGCALAP